MKLELKQVSRHARRIMDETPRILGRLARLAPVLVAGLSLATSAGAQFLSDTPILIAHPVTVSAVNGANANSTPRVAYVPTAARIRAATRTSGAHKPAPTKTRKAIAPARPVTKKRAPAAASMLAQTRKRPAIVTETAPPMPEAPAKVPALDTAPPKLAAAPKPSSPPAVSDPVPTTSAQPAWPPRTAGAALPAASALGSATITARQADAAVLPQQRQPVADTASLLPDEVLVALAPASPPGTEQDIAQRHNLRFIEQSEIRLLDQRIVRYRIPDGRTVPAVVAALQQRGGAIAAQPNYLYRLQTSATHTTAPAGPQYALAKLDARSANNFATGQGAVVAVFDTAVDTRHPDLAGSAIDVYDAAGGGDPAPGTHGTAIAGLIAGRGVARGLAPDTKLLGVRAFTVAKGGAAQSNTYVLLKGVDWSLTKAARVLNFSFAGPRDALVEHAVAAAKVKGAIIVAAAGNGGPTATPAYPAAYDGVIAVTATDADDKLYAKANRGAYIAIAAPGVDVLAPAAGDAHEMHSGTSFAAAYVSAIVALVLERYPQISLGETRQVLQQATVDLGHPGTDNEFGAGRISAAAAVRAVSRP